VALQGLIPDLLRKRIAHAIQQAADLQAVPHTGLRGRFRELLVGDVIEPLLPPTCGIYSGTAIDSNGVRFEQLSDDGSNRVEDDILIVDREVIPPILFRQLINDGIIPYESVLARTEVKSRLNATELKKAIDGAKLFRAMGMGLPPADLIGSAPLRDIFAFGTDLQPGGMSEFERLAKNVIAAGGRMDEPPITSLCVVGRGTWGHLNGDDGKGEWKFCPPTPEYNEVLTYLGVLLNSLPGLRTKRQAARFGNYLVDPADFVKVNL
jgi:hypothetical protein